MQMLAKEYKEYRFTYHGEEHSTIAEVLFALILIFNEKITAFLNKHSKLRKERETVWSS